ncbi:MAG: methylenetetrahydrofolate--tRNA-(uracil(54)-C(5))-methyltransferase (FADH(2)-oxidizing) TrmFO [Geobacteraceae bacterium]|nr:methylenetetrahydrofolate--tRNA-(uracil(54)-C(5))-methyltransferase (FADH(2)-oxidizing) TrmFO [Geobacteraceae bacterium]
MITIIGAGLAGCEAAWQAASRGVNVTLYEMKPDKLSPAHELSSLAELVCSNSLRGDSLDNAVGLLKEELRRVGSLFMEAAEATRVPAGGALAVNRLLFSEYITDKISKHPLITVVHKELCEIPTEGVVIIASGPLTSEPLAESITGLAGDYLYFYDAIAPIVTAESIDMDTVFAASRYGKGDGDDYLNCPFKESEYVAFIDAINCAEKVPSRDFEKVLHFEGCMPVEELASRGVDTLRFGAMKPVGLPDPKSGEDSHAIVQLRKENLEGSLYNLVGFQTKMTWPEQKRVFRMIPGLQDADFARLGSMHRNTFINSPALLLPTLQLKSDPRIFFAGQITGVEGYVESAGAGFIAGLNAACLAKGEDFLQPPQETALGALVHHVTNADVKHFQPMNVNYGLFPAIAGKIKKKDKRGMLAERALTAIDRWRSEL